MPTSHPSSDPLVQRLADHARRVEQRLLHHTALDPHTPPKLREAMDYSLLAGGKRLRPALLLEWHDACAGTHADDALDAACAVELIHTFSLVHDDLPAMDDDDLRRGRPTNHKVFGEALAILAGDAMTLLAFEVLSRLRDPSRIAPLVRELAHAAGPAGMCGGQVLDIAAENSRLPLHDLRQLHALKTGALLTASCRMGAICAGAADPLVDAATAYGQHLGLAFQIIDDVLDATGTPEQLGKATQKDASRGKNTYPSLMGLDESRTLAARELDAALAALAPLGDRAEPLRLLARFVVARDH